ncbi:MAG: acetolactate synthase [Eubacterium sp.]|nr:acetolactate synthase [Eubacterium sp.]
MSVKQISVFLENRPGTLISLTEALAENNIDLRAMSLAETKDFGIARLIVDDVYEASTVLKDAGLISSLTPVVAAAIPEDQPGGLNAILKVLKEADVNVEYMYASLGMNAEDAYMILRVTDTEKAERALTKNGIRLVGQEEISE